MSDSLSLSFLVLLETLSPVERAVFLLREVFDYGYDEIAQIVDKSEANCRQIFARARRRIDRGQAPLRDRPGSSRGSSSSGSWGPSRAARSQGFIELIAPDVVFYGDGGGKAPRACRARSTARAGRAPARRVRCAEYAGDRGPGASRPGQRAAGDAQLRRRWQADQRVRVRGRRRSDPGDPLDHQPRQARAPRLPVSTSPAKRAGLTSQLSQRRASSS